MKVAIIGSRTFPNCDLVRTVVFALPRGTIVISGGAIGVNTWAETAAREARLSRWIFEPHAKAGCTRAEYNAALFARNRLIVETCQKLLAFHSNSSRGTAYGIDYARKLGKDVQIYSA